MLFNAIDVSEISWCGDGFGGSGRVVHLELIRAHSVAASTKAITPDFIACGKLDHASITIRNSGDSWSDSATLRATRSNPESLTS